MNTQHVCFKLFLFGKYDCFKLFNLTSATEIELKGNFLQLKVLQPRTRLVGLRVCWLVGFGSPTFHFRMPPVANRISTPIKAVDTCLNEICKEKNGVALAHGPVFYLPNFSWTNRLNNL